MTLSWAVAITGTIYIKDNPQTTPMADVRQPLGTINQNKAPQPNLKKRGSENTRSQGPFSWNNLSRNYVMPCVHVAPYLASSRIRQTRCYITSNFTTNSHSRSHRISEPTQCSHNRLQSTGRPFRSPHHFPIVTKELRYILEVTLPELCFVSGGMHQYQHNIIATVRTNKHVLLRRQSTCMSSACCPGIGKT